MTVLCVWVQGIRFDLILISNKKLCLAMLISVTMTFNVRSYVKSLHHIPSSVSALIHIFWPGWNSRAVSPQGLKYLSRPSWDISVSAQLRYFCLGLAEIFLSQPGWDISVSGIKGMSHSQILNTNSSLIFHFRQKYYRTVVYWFYILHVEMLYTLINSHFTIKIGNLRNGAKWYCCIFVKGSNQSNPCCFRTKSRF